MTTVFVSRHPGAREWAKERSLKVDNWVAHLNTANIFPGDVVIGTLPINLVADVCARGARYFNLSLDMPAHLRGQELTAAMLEDCQARLEEYCVERKEIA